jgi:hypothetical protein
MAEDDRGIKAEADEKKTGSPMGIGIVMGAGIGAGLGAATGNMGFWLPIGAGVGLTFGAAMGANSGKSSHKARFPRTHSWDATRSRGAFSCAARSGYSERYEQ